jgi:hypothetical protein
LFLNSFSLIQQETDFGFRAVVSRVTQIYYIIYSVFGGNSTSRRLVDGAYDSHDISDYNNCPKTLVSSHGKFYYLQFMCYYCRFKILPILSNIYNYITRWANRQVSSWAFAISSPGILYLDAICNTSIIYNLCSDGQLCTVNVLQQSTLFVTFHYLQFFREVGTIFYSWDGVTYWHFLCSNTHIPYEGPLQYLQSQCFPCCCGTWSLFTFRAPLPINPLEVITICFGISYCV